jgi:hypothetical protein
MRVCSALRTGSFAAFLVCAVALFGAAVAFNAAVAMAQTRLPTDAALRSGMSDIRAAVIDHHTLITHRRLPVAMAQKFKTRVTHTITAIRTTTGVPADVRAALDPLLETIDASAGIIGIGGDSVGQMDALFALTKALETYGRTFDDPDWKPIQER